MSFSVVGKEGTEFVVKTLESLMEGDWIPVYTNTISGGEFTYEDTDIESLPSKFYRIIKSE